MLSKFNIYFVVLFSTLLITSTMAFADKSKKLTAAEYKKLKTSEYVWSTNFKKRGKIRLGKTEKVYIIKSMKNKNGGTCVIKVSELSKIIMKEYTKQAGSAEEIEFIAPKTITATLGLNEYETEINGNIERFTWCGGSGYGCTVTIDLSTGNPI